MKKIMAALALTLMASSFANSLDETKWTTEVTIDEFTDEKKITSLTLLRAVLIRDSLQLDVCQLLS